MCVYVFVWVKEKVEKELEQIANSSLTRRRLKVKKGSIILL